MKKDIAGYPVFTEKEILDHLYEHPDFDIHKVDKSVEQKAPVVLEFYSLPDMLDIEPLNKKKFLKEVDTLLQSYWQMPDSYKTLDVVTYVWDRKKGDTEEEKDRIMLEMNLFLQRKLLDLLRYLVYLVDTMRANKVVWGVGRGSSVSSYVLFLIGVHKINSLEFNLDPKEFFK